mgnify:CR=1 FL=1
MFYTVPSTDTRQNDFFGIYVYTEETNALELRKLPCSGAIHNIGKMTALTDENLSGGFLVCLAAYVMRNGTL